MKIGLVSLFIALCLMGCRSAGLYGHSRTYEPLDEEEEAAHNAKEYDPVMVKRAEAEWKEHPVSVFGVVLSRADGRGGMTKVKLSVRALEPRNLCETADEDTCRVTVSEREHAIVHALLPLRSEDDIGQYSLGPSSLVRVIGKLSDEVDPADGEPVIVASYYRHWPSRFYVTTAARSYMRR